VIFKALVLQALYNLSDDQAEYQLRDRLSFMRFLGLGIEDAVPDAKTLWLYREALAKAGAVEELFDLFDAYLKDKGYLAMGGRSSTQRSCGAQAAQFCNHDLRFVRGERDDQGTRDVGRREIEAGQEPPSGQGRALDEEA